MISGNSDQNGSRSQGNVNEHAFIKSNTLGVPRGKPEVKGRTALRAQTMKNDLRASLKLEYTIQISAAGSYI